MTATQLAQKLLDLASEAGHDLPVHTGDDDGEEVWLVVKELIDQPNRSSKEVIHVY